MHAPGGEQEETQDDKGQEPRVEVRHLGEVLGIINVEAHGTSDSCGEQVQCEAIQQALHGHVTPGHDVPIQVVAGGNLEARGSCCFQAICVVCLCHADVDGKDVQDQHQAHQQEAYDSHPAFEGDKVELFLHFNDVAGSSHHETGHHAELGEGRQPLIQDVALKEPRVVLQVHRLGLDHAEGVLQHP